MPYDIDWETACNDFHPDFALVRGERYDPSAKPVKRQGRRDRGIATSAREPGLRRVRLAPAVLTLPEFSQ